MSAFRLFGIRPRIGRIAAMLAIASVFSVSVAEAGVVPGTIKEGYYNTSNTCNTSSSPTYSYYSYGCTDTYCKQTEQYECGGWTPNTCTCNNSTP